MTRLRTKGASSVRRIELSLYAVGPPVITNFNIEVGTIEGGVTEGKRTYNTLTPLQKDDGTAAESLAEVMQANGGGLEEGEFERRVELPERRWLVAEGGRAEIKALSWHETIRKGEPTVTVLEGKGNPVLVLQQLDENGAATSGRLVVDQDLWAWDLDDQNNVVPRGALA